MCACGEHGTGAGREVERMEAVCHTQPLEWGGLKVRLKKQVILWLLGVTA